MTLQVRYSHLGVATVLLQVDGLTIITDPCLDDSGGYFHHGWGAISKKTQKPSPLSWDRASQIDFALVSHGHHLDNLDSSGRDLLTDVSPILTTKKSARTLDGAIGLSPGDTYTYRGDSSCINIHAISAQHGVFPVSVLAGPVIGFLLDVGAGEKTIYVTGDTVYSEQIADELRAHTPIDLFVPHLGNAFFPYLSGPLRYTMNAADLRRFLEALRPSYVLPVHNTGWSHFRPVDYEAVAEEFESTSFLARPAGQVEL